MSVEVAMEKEVVEMMLVVVMLLMVESENDASVQVDGHRQWCCELDHVHGGGHGGACQSWLQLRCVLRICTIL